MKPIPHIHKRMDSLLQHQKVSQIYHLFLFACWFVSWFPVCFLSAAVCGYIPILLNRIHLSPTAHCSGAIACSATCWLRVSACSLCTQLLVRMCPWLVWMNRLLIYCIQIHRYFISNCDIQTLRLLCRNCYLHTQKGRKPNVALKHSNDLMLVWSPVDWAWVFVACAHS